MEKTPVGKTTARKFKWFWPWQDEQEEAWLSATARAGLHLRSSDGAGFYTFEQGQPAEIVYRLIYNTLAKKDKEQYLQLFRDAGWEYVGEMNSWQYFRKPVKAGRSDEIFSDNESKLEKYKRYLSATLVMLPIYVMFLVVLDINERPFLYGMILGFFTVCVVLLCGIAFKVYLRMQQLKKL